MAAKSAHNSSARRTALTFSGALHTILALLLIFGLPSLFLTKSDPEPIAISVEILPIAAITNIKPSETPPTPVQKPEEKKPEAKKPTPAVKAAEPTPPPPPKPEEKKAEVPKPPEPKKEEKKEKEKPKSLDDIFKSIKDQQAKEQKDKPDKAKEAASPSKSQSLVPYDPSLPLSQTMKDSIRQQLMKCWAINAGAKDAYKLVVTLDIYYNRDATPLKVDYTADTKAKMNDPAYRAAAEAAYRAVFNPDCNPLKGLPADKYEGWSYTQFTFDPKDQAY